MLPLDLQKKKSVSTEKHLGYQIKKIWVGHVARMGERRGVYTILVWTPEGRSNLEDLGLEGRIMLKWIFKK